MAVDPRDLILRSHEDKATGANPRDPYLWSHEDKAADGEPPAPGVIPILVMAPRVAI